MKRNLFTGLIIVTVIALCCFRTNDKKQERYFMAGYVANTLDGKFTAGQCYCWLVDFENDTIKAIIQRQTPEPLKNILVVGIYEFHSKAEAQKFYPQKSIGP